MIRTHSKVFWIGFHFWFLFRCSHTFFLVTGDKKWPGGVVRYQFDKNMTREGISIFEKAFEEYQSKTCLRFAQNETGDQDVVNIEVDNNVCGTSNICKVGGYQFIRVGTRCMDTPTIIHELGHTLCLDHETQRSDRDNYLTFQNCAKKPYKLFRSKNIPKGIYDYASIMNYDCNGCNGGWPTMPNVTKCGREASPGLSVLDADRINDLFDCQGCHRHRWRPIESLTFKDKTNLYSFGYELYICRAMIEGGIVAGKFDLDSNICLIYYNFKLHVVKDIFEVLTIPGGLNRHCSVYSLVHRNITILANALPVGTQVDSKGSWRSYIAIGEAPTENGSTKSGVGNAWVYNGTGFWKDANLVVGDFGALSSNYKVLTCELDVKSHSCLKPSLVEETQPQGNKKNFSQTYENKQRSLSTLNISVGTVLLFLLLLLICVSSFLFMRYKKMKRFLTKTENKEFFEGRLLLTTIVENTNGVEDILGKDDIDALKFYEHFKLLRNQITIDIETLLGSGAFGFVYAGTAKDINAAIKVPKPGCSLETFKSFLIEVKVMGYLGSHENILGFIGAYVNEIRYGVLQIATELCTQGSLESFLRKKKHVRHLQNDLRQKDQLSVYACELNRFALEIARGMEYIASKKVVHGDIATRNVFLNTDFVCKIGDFGLSRKLNAYEMYIKKSQDLIPWKWMAPESLTRMEFTCKSDVWGYGICIWEIFTLGGTPYAGLSWSPSFVNEIEQGLRLPPPQYASSEIYAKLRDCWHFDPSQRTTCSSMVQFFAKISNKEYIELEVCV